MTDMVTLIFPSDMGVVHDSLTSSIFLLATFDKCEFHLQLATGGESRGNDSPGRSSVSGGMDSASQSQRASPNGAILISTTVTLTGQRRQRPHSETCEIVFCA